MPEYTDEQRRLALSFVSERAWHPGGQAEAIAETSTWKEEDAGFMAVEYVSPKKVEVVI
jgi:hypothetical protein